MRMSHKLKCLDLAHSTRWLSSKRRLAWYPPFWLMRLKVLELDPQWRRVRIRLPLTWFSRNMGGSMFGGWQASLADPIAPLACAKAFPEYDVWTRRLTLDFQAPGSADIELRFDMDEAVIERIRQELAERGRATPTFHYGFFLPDGRCCTQVECAVAIRPAGYRSPRA